jgi:hypothetical protein
MRGCYTIGIVLDARQRAEAVLKAVGLPLARQSQSPL